jgi:iron complex transport system substrate-binding protein
LNVSAFISTIGFFMATTDNPGWRTAGTLAGLTLFGLLLLFGLPRLLPGPAPLHGPSPADLSDTFPLIHVDDYGRTVSIPKPPLRLVSLAPSLTEILFAIGAGPQVVGVTRYCEYPPGASVLPRVGGMSDPSIEALGRLRPDLVLATDFTPRAVVDAVERAGFRVVVLSLGGLKKTWSDMRTVGRLLGRARAGVDLATRSRARCEALRPPSFLPRPRVLLLYGTEGFYSAGPGSFAGELIEWAGGENLAAQTASPWPQLSLETILVWNPDVILITCRPDEAARERTRRAIAAMKTDPRWQPVRAARLGRIHTVANGPFTVQGPRLAEGIEEVVRILHPERTW